MESDTHSIALIKLPTEQLLAKFGSGGHKPGSGSAAALISLVSCKMLETVVKLTKGRDQYQDVHEQLTLANQHVLDAIEPFLKTALQQDAVQFDRVIELRRLRNAESDPVKRKALQEQHREELRQATELPLEIAARSLDLADKALAAFDLGFKSARGDSAVAISAAISGAVGSLSIVFLNLGSFRGGKWAHQIKNRTEELMVRANAMQLQLAERIGRLRQEAEQKNSLEDIGES